MRWFEKGVDTMLLRYPDIVAHFNDALFSDKSTSVLLLQYRAGQAGDFANFSILKR